MARKSLSDQVMEEIDRARGLLKPVQDIVDPMTSHMVGAVLESLHRVETMCLAAKQRTVNELLSDVGRDLTDLANAPDREPARRRSAAQASHKRAPK